jgi:CheY-like chemotaxis protein
MPPKVLLVDDDPLIHRLYRPHLERAGYQVVSASSGLQAIELASREVPQVIVMDIMMPEIDGLSAIREIRQDEATKNIPVIVITANPQYHLSQQESQRAGASCFLTKPFSPASLLSAIQRLVPTTE